MRIVFVGSDTVPAQDQDSLRVLQSAMAERGHQVTTIPVGSIGEELGERLESYERCMALELSEFDLVVAGAGPGWLITHERLVVVSSGDGLASPPAAATSDPRLDGLEDCDTVVALTAAARTVADTVGVDDPLVEPDGPLARAVAFRLEQLVFSGTRVRRLVVPSEFSAERFEAVGWEQPIMVAPPASPAPAVGNHVPPRAVCFSESRFEGDDRIAMLIEGFTTIDDPHAELRISGDGPYRESMEEAIPDPRVHFLGPIDDATRQDELVAASSVAVLSPQQGWSHLGFEAMSLGTPLVAPSDAGGITEIIEHGINGVVVEPNPERLAWGIRHIASSPRLRWQLGLQARRRAAELSSSRLLDELEDLASPAERPRILTLSTYPVDPMVGGGQRRARFLSRALARRCDVTVLVNSSPSDHTRRRLVEPGLTQIEVPKSSAQREAELDIFHAMGKIPVDDITAAELSPATPAFRAELSRHMEHSDAIVATQPFLVPSIPPTDLPIVHDSQNVETDLKTELLPDTAGGRWLLDLTAAAEVEAGRRAAVVTACTEQDLERLDELASPSSPPGFVVGNGVDARALPRRTDIEHLSARSELVALAGASESDRRPIAVFLGSWHPPNIGAARLILELAERRDDWLFILAGSHTSEFATDPVPENVHLIAVFAESLLWPLLAGADVALNPMLSGGGSNLKLFDYLSVGTPIAATAVGARGLDGPDRYAVIADPTVDGFAAAIDQAREMASSADGISSLDAGRRMVEAEYDWQLLGERWTDGILTALDLTPGPARPPADDRHRPVLSSVAPPSTDPVIATMQLVGQQATTMPPSPQEVSMDPALRERIKQANENRNIGRILPAGARFRAPKKAVIRVGQAFTNEQVVYNTAMVEAVEQLAVSLRSLETEQRELKETVESLIAENQALQRRLEVLE